MIRINGVDKASTIHQQSDIAHGTYHLADNANLYEIQRNNNFEFIVTDLDNLVRAGMEGTENLAKFDNPQEKLRLSVSSAAVPHFSQNAIEIKRGNGTLKYAGAPTFTDCSFTFTDYIGAETKAILEAWQAMSYDVRTQKVGISGDYKKKAYLIEYSPDWQIVNQWVYYGCWISSMSEGDYSHESDDKRQVTVKIEYDHAEVDTSELE